MMDLLLILLGIGLNVVGHVLLMSSLTKQKSKLTLGLARFYSFVVTFTNKDVRFLKAEEKKIKAELGVDCPVIYANRYMEFLTGSSKIDYLGLYAHANGCAVVFFQKGNSIRKKVDTLAHELRHAYQFNVAPHMFVDIDKQEKNDGVEYLGLTIERDARAYAAKYTAKSFASKEARAYEAESNAKSVVSKEARERANNRAREKAQQKVTRLVRAKKLVSQLYADIALYPESEAIYTESLKYANKEIEYWMNE